jgi:uncharacterized repeat protein (TIGR04052 family)
MNTKRYVQRFAELGIAMTAVAALIAGCGGGSSSSPATTTTLSGIVADGYLSGVKVCLDKNDNGVCDASEPFATTNASGVYSIPGLATADVAAYAVVAEIPASAVDSDFPAATVGQTFTLSAPKGNGIITPLSALVHQEMLKNTALPQASAVANVQTATGIPTTINPLDDYIAKGYGDVHNAARVLVNSIKTNTANAGGASGKQLNAILLEAALSELQNQGVLSASGVAVVDITPASHVAVANPASAVAGTYNAAYLAAIAAATQTVTIKFDVVNGATANIRCGTPLTINNTLWDHQYSAYASGVAASTASAVPAAAALQFNNAAVAQATAGTMADLRFYISNVKLIDGSGNAVPVLLDKSANQEKGVALLDFGHTVAPAGGTPACTSTYNTQIVGKVKPGTYSGLSMTLGVPVKAADGVSRLNHSNQFATVGTASPLQNIDMAWAWQGGRKFTKIEFVPSTPINKPSASKLDATATNWNVHLGSTGCGANTAVQGLETVCTNPNRMDMTFSPFDTVSNVIALDLSQLFKKADLTFDAGGPAGCMSGGTDPECAPIFNALGVSMVNGSTVTTPVAPSSTSFGEAVQSVFVVRP